MESTSSPRGLDAAAVGRAMASAGLDAPARYLPETGSTNADALALAEEGAPEWTLVAAGHQTAGRGRLGRSWASEPGSMLQFSLVLRPALAPDRAGLLTLLAGAAMASACRQVTGVAVGCKWPNDLVVGEGKVGGILAEARIADARVDHVVVGVGVNLGDPPPGLPTAAGLGAGAAAAEAVLTAFLRGFAETHAGPEEAFADAVLARWREVAVTPGLRVRATTTDGQTVEGLATDVAPDGSLRVRTDDGSLVTVAFGEIHHLR